MMIIDAGSKHVVCEKHYHAEKDATELFGKAAVELVVNSDQVEEYDRQ